MSLGFTCVHQVLSVVWGSHFLPSDHEASPLLSTSATVFYGIASTDVCVRPQFHLGPLCPCASSLSLCCSTVPPNPFLYSISSTATNWFFSFLLLQRRIPLWLWTTVGFWRRSLSAFWRRQSSPFSSMPTRPPKWHGWKMAKPCLKTTIHTPKQATLRGIGENDAHDLIGG